MASLIVERFDGVSLVRVSRPEKRNALTLVMLRDLADTMEQEVLQGAAALVIAGDDGVFSAGVDLGELGNGVADLEVDDRLEATIDRLRALPVPLVAAIEGPCVGGAVELALTCDARVAAEGSFFAVPATRLGVLYRPEGIASLVATLGRDAVSRLFLFNERLGPHEALRIGLATHTCERGAAVESALALCEGVSRSTPSAVRATKELVHELMRSDEDLAHWSERRRDLLDSEERRRALEDSARRRQDGR